MRTDPRDGMVAWWERQSPNRWVFVETPGNVILAAVVYSTDKDYGNPLYPWKAVVCDETWGQFEKQEHAIKWAEEKGLAFTEVAKHGPDHIRH